MRGDLQNIRRFSSLTMLSWGMIGVGIVLRLARYVANRSLWLDEASLALNIINRSWAGFLKPLDYDQAAPFGFLVLEKCVVQLLGHHEYALRLIPLLAGIVSLLLFYHIAPKFIQPAAVPVAVGLFVIAEPLIFYSSEVKQYALDVVVALVVFLIAQDIWSRPLTFLRLALFAAAGAVGVWFSFPVIFTLTGVGGVLILRCSIRKERNQLFRLLVVCALWAASFLISYLVYLREISSSEYLPSYWAGAFIPFPPTSYSDIQWLLDTFFGIFNHPAGLEQPGLAAFAFLVGCWAMFLEQKGRLLLLLSPILVTAVASILHQYPFSSRLLLFIAPILLMLIAEGTVQVRAKTGPFTAAVGAALIGLLFVQPVFLAGESLINPPTREEIRPVLEHVAANWQDGDLAYVYYGAVTAFQYYAERYRFSDRGYVFGIPSRGDWTNYVHDLDKLRDHGRVWVLFSHVYKKDVDEEKLFVYYLDSMGTRLEVFKRPGAVVYLYDLDASAPDVR